MNTKKKILSVIALMTIVGLAAFSTPSNPSSASSHREAPLISTDPQVDNTDVYAFVSPNDPSSVTLIANYIPLQQPAAGPNFYRFADAPGAVYEINVDSAGNAMANITYRFEFRSQIVNPNTFLYNTGPINNISDATYNIRQFYNVTRIRRATVNGNFTITASEVIARDVPVPPANIGPRSTPNYDNLANQAIKPLSDGGKVFAGQRDDPFFVDLGSVFDLLGLRPLNNAHAIPLPTAPGVDGVAGYNVHTLALQVPISTLQLQNGVMGVWAESKRLSTRVITGLGEVQNGGGLVQMSRLSNPLINEVINPLAQKDLWNGSRPDNDAQFASNVLNPEPTRLINLLYGGAIPDSQKAPTTNRTDLVTVFLTGIPGVNQLPNVRASEMIRLNTRIPPSANPNRLGVVAGDNAGFPNGRRLGDDVVDIELRALECSYGVVGTVGPCDASKYNKAPNNALTDGVDANDKPFLSSFPYVASPFAGYEAQPPTAGPSKVALGVIGTSATAGLVLVFLYWRRRSANHKPVENSEA